MCRCDHTWVHMLVYICARVWRSDGFACVCWHVQTCASACWRCSDKEGELEDNPVLSIKMRVVCTCTRRLFLGEDGCGRVCLPKYVRAWICRCVRKGTPTQLAGFSFSSPPENEVVNPFQSPKQNPFLRS